jgi:hypothetical protein
MCHRGNPDDDGLLIGVGTHMAILAPCGTVPGI